MKPSQLLSTTIAALGLVAATAVYAGETTPGLWEIQVEGSANQNEQMAQAMKELQNMDPEQRKMMESMMAGMGINLSKPNVIQTCITPEEAKKREIELQDDQDCKQEILEKSDSRIKIKFKCDDSEGTATVIFNGNKAYETTIDSTVMEDGQKKQVRQSLKAKWVQADCGSIR